MAVELWNSVPDLVGVHRCGVHGQQGTRVIGKDTCYVRSSVNLDLVDFGCKVSHQKVLGWCMN